MIITWLCLFIITFNICSEGQPNAPAEPSKSHKLRSLKTKVIIGGNRTWNFVKSLPSRTKNVIAWIRKNIDFGIKCTRISKFKMMCLTHLKTNSKLVFSYKIWISLPSFLQKLLTSKSKNKPLPETTKTAKTS